jgi:hypothetical protein
MSIQQTVVSTVGVIPLSAISHLQAVTDLPYLDIPDRGGSQKHSLSAPAIHPA